MADDRYTDDCGCEHKYYSGVGWSVKPCDDHKDKGEGSGLSQ